MINEEEIMIGNYLLLRNKIVEVDGISEYYGINFSFFEGGYGDAGSIYKEDNEDFKPIPLTENILIRCGFVESTNDPDNKWLRYNLEGHNISIESDESCGFNVAYLQLGRKSIEVTELHSLQNLIF